MVDEMPNFLYIMENTDWRGKYKYGFSTSLKNRICSSHEQHSYLTNYKNIFQVKQIPHKYKLHKEFDKLFSTVLRRPNFVWDLNMKYGFHETEEHIELQRIKDNLIDENGGKEFIKQEGLETMIRFIEHGFQKFGIDLVKSFTDEEIKKINSDRKREYQKKQDEETRLFDAIFDKPAPPPKKIEPYKWNPRDYQIEIIKESIERLERDNKIYIELATGGGKSYIVFKILQHFRPKTIVIFSPRKKINEQNTDQRYLDLLEDKYEKFNCSTDGNISKFLKKPVNKIIVCCSQSAEKLYENIKKSDIKDIMVWYDEAHWGFGEWINEENIKEYEERPDKQFWLEDTTKISKKIFVSASPNQNLVRKNQKYYGELLQMIKVNKLIEDKWLCPIIPYVFAMDKKKEDVKILKYILEDFKKEDRTWGFSFHSKQTNAFSLFYYHFKEFTSKNTNIRPYILIGDDFYDILKKNKGELEKMKITEKKNGIEIKRNYRDEEIKDILKIKGFYEEVKNYFRENSIEKYNFDCIEDYQKTKNSIGYVVQRFSMGYDFKNIDYIVFSDRKTAYKDIIQCIGRGTRSDKLGENGKNLNKELKFYMPVYYEKENDFTEEKYDFSNVIKVLRYLIIDLTMKIEDLGASWSDSKGIKKFNFLTDGNDKIQSELLDLLYHHKILRPMNLPRLYEFCFKNNITKEEEYNKYKENRSIRLKDNIYSYTGFYWQNVIDPKKNIYYASLKECKKARDKILKEKELNEEFYEDYEDDGWIELKKYDSKIPNYRDLERFYPK